MELPVLIFYILVGIIVPVLLFMMLRIALKKKPYKFKMIFRTPGLDTHFTVYGDNLDFSHKIAEKEYEIKAERLYRLKPNRLKPKILTKIWFKIQGVKESFIIVYLHGKTEPLAPVNVAVSARILKEVSESRALDKALRSEFSVPWDLKKILMVVGFLVIAVVVWVLISGEVNL